MRKATLGRTAAIMCFIVCFGTGCTRQKMTSVPVDTAHWRIRLSVTPHQPRQLDPVQFQVKISDTNRKPVSGATVTAQIAMPAMEMGRNEVEMREMAQSGTYTGTGRFTMPGNWQATVTADRGAGHQAQTFPLSVR